MLAFRVARGAYALGRRSHAGQHPFARRQAPYSTAKLHAAKSGDFVAVHYTGTLDDGTVFDSSRQRDPLTFVVGAGKVVQGFDTAVTGLDVGGTRKSRIPPEQAYGQRDPSLTMTFPASSAPKGLEQGMQVQLSNGMVATVVKMSPEELVLDMNHELTGKHLTFDVELMNLVAAESMRKATFGAGCFWGVELAFQRVPGVLATEVGYCNGFVDDPTYEAVCSGNTGHAEVVQLVYDPSQVSYETLLDVFWDKHDPTTLNRQGGDSGTQYRSGIYCHTEEQKEVAAKSMAKAQARFKAPITTEIADISKYSAAEAYHQAYLARGGRFGQPQNPSKGCTDPIRCYG